jgi:hypothetical protein
MFQKKQSYIQRRKTKKKKRIKCSIKKTVGDKQYEKTAHSTVTVIDKGRGSID